MEVEDLRNLYDMEEIDYENRYIPEEVAPYTKEIFKLLKDQEVNFLNGDYNIYSGKICSYSWLYENLVGYK